jgi:sulfite reductase beta subunit-like hemoprotein
VQSIVATQRDHGNREIRLNARMKYLVEGVGVDKFRSLVEGYFGKEMEPWRPIQPWKYVDHRCDYDDDRNHYDDRFSEGHLRSGGVA